MNHKLLERKEVCFDEKFEKMEDVKEFMLNYHVGQDKAVTAKEIASKFDIQIRTVKLIMKDLVKQGIPVVAYDGTETEEGIQGFFVAQSQEEIDNYVTKYQEKIDALYSKIEDIEKCFRSYKKEAVLW